jgi:recombination protein RecA
MSIEALAKALGEAIGENAEQTGIKNYIDTGYGPLNAIISGRADGGIPQGRLMEMYGPSSSGKTAIATQMLINAQKAGGVAGFMDHERSFNIELAKHMGLDETFGRWVYKLPKTWEESNMVMAKAAQAIRRAKLIAEDAPILFVLDSIAAALPKSMAEKEIDEYNMNDTTALARVTSTTLKSMAAHAEEYNFSVLYLNQTRTKPGVVYGDPTTTPGGTSMEFYSTVRIALSRKKIMEDSGKEKRFIGQVITMKTVKNKLTRPFQEIEWKMMFDEDGHGYFDIVGSMVDYLVDAGKLKAAGGRVTWLDGKSYFRRQLIEKINTEGLSSELNKLAS